MRQPRWSDLWFLLVAAGFGCQRAGVAVISSPPTDVVVARPLVRDVTDFEEFTGHTDAILSVQIKARVTGYLDKKDFQDGQEVQEGDILYEIDDRPYRTALQSAESRVAQAEAHRDRLAADFKRASNLFQRAAIGRQEYDLISSNFAESEAQFAASKAQQENDRLNMTFTKVRAPMSGQLSRTLVDPGNLIRQNSTILNDIVSVDQIYVYFDVSQDAMNRVKFVIEQGKVGGKDNKEVPIEIGTSLDADRHDDALNHLRDLQEQKKVPTDEDKKIPREFPYDGRVNFSENKLDAATGTLRVRGTVHNPADARLCPGLFVRVRLPIGEPHASLLVPEDSIGSDQGGNYLYIVSPSDQVESRPVEVGATFTGGAGTKLRVIRRGIAAGERFVQDSEALRRLRPGSKVAPKMVPVPSAFASTAPSKIDR